MISEQLNKVAFLLKGKNPERWALYRVGFDTESEAVWNLTDSAAMKLVATLKQYPSFFEVDSELVVNLPEVVAIDRRGKNGEQFVVYFNRHPRDGRKPVRSINHSLILREPATRRIIAAHEFLEAARSTEEDPATAN